MNIKLPLFNTYIVCKYELIKKVEYYYGFFFINFFIVDVEIFESCFICAWFKKVNRKKNRFKAGYLFMKEGSGYEFRC